ncbi:fatty acid cis/trans isomerase [Cerasicoccus fimbriatus]|uniref:fatty acid cis/trans isomerase n=1 Tax=Cerasicoccus fimbriatus TaxID=3014554 RepID=UPI0022B4FF6E|nr:fatty acid cis/trans isomerase [Cerasicoccus sp. TK19100]
MVKILLGLVLLLVLLIGALVAVYNLAPDFQKKFDSFVADSPNYGDAIISDPAAVIAQDRYLSQIQPIFNARCIACHGCLNSPCLLKLTCYEGLARGARPVNPDGTHLFPERPVRLNDEPSVEAWRKRGFFSVVAEDKPEGERLQNSILYKMIMAGYAHNQGDFALAPVADVHANANNHVCASGGKIDTWLQNNPAAGMPFALPALNATEIQVLTDWIKDGAPGPTPEAQAALNFIPSQSTIDSWEKFLNQDDERSPLVSRYLYEHTFLATYHFDAMPDAYFRLVRSATPPGQPIEEIVTSRPFDDPFVSKEVKKVYYRLQKITEARAQKSFFVWELGDADRARLEEIFFAEKWNGDGPLNPGYASHNPFEVFRAIPAMQRATFLYENSKLIVSGMIQGPVCVGNLATYAIKDYFWAFFVKPESDPAVLNPELGMKHWEDFMSFSERGNEAYEQAYKQVLYQYKPDGYAITDIWDGGRKNPNAWLTILRNETNASVVYGRKGGIPPTFWLVDFSGLERLYYSLVADYTYWGSTEEKLSTWTFMGYLRQEFEDNFLRLLPPSERQHYRNQWTQGIGQDILFTMPFPGEDAPSAVKGDDTDPISHVLAQIQARLGEQVSGPPDPLNPAQTRDKVTLPERIESIADWENAVAGLTMRTHQSFTPFLPSLTYVRLKDGAQDHVYTIVANRAYAFNDLVFDENGAAQPELDTMSVYKSVIGDFPNLLVEVELSDALTMLQHLKAVKTTADWTAWKKKYGALRNEPDFWQTFDWFTEWNFANRAPLAGHFDLTYYMFQDSDF